jgi:hypothetical protein
MAGFLVLPIHATVSFTSLKGSYAGFLLRERDAVRRRGFELNSAGSSLFADFQSRSRS